MSTFTQKALAGLATAAAAAAVLTLPGSASAKPAAPSGNLFARVDASGAVVASSAGASSTALGSGRYEVTFGQDVSGCAYLATTENAYSQAAQAYTAGGHASANGVYVETKNQGGGLTPAPFDLVVDCGSAATPFAVVGYAGQLVRSSDGVSLTSLGAGRYDVQFPSAVNTCAPLATVADPGSALVYNPAGVYTGLGPDTRTVYIETKNPGGGLQSGVPFHLAMMCAGATGVHAAVLGANGLPAHSVGSMLGYHAATGTYDMVSRGSLADCATVATRGSTTKAVPYTPSTVETVAGPAANTVGVQVRTLLQFGGNLDDQSFAVASVC